MRTKLPKARKPIAAMVGLAAALAVPLVGVGAAGAQQGENAQGQNADAQGQNTQGQNDTTTPIQHVVVIFQENVSFDHYFGTYPDASNTDGVPFTAAPGTPAVNGLNTPAPGGGTLLTNNPNGTNPRRLDPNTITDLLTCDQDHDYTDEQVAFDGGLMDKFTSAVATTSGTGPAKQTCQASDVMNYYDGNTLSALWGYAQGYAMSDNSYGTTFGPSSPGAINLVSGDTAGVDPATEIRGVSKDTPNADVVTGGDGTDSLTSDAQPYYDDCSSRDSVALTGQNIGDLLNGRGLSWGWFEGGFAPTIPYSGPPTPAGTYNPLSVTGRTKCGASHPIGVALGDTGQYGSKTDYIPHHEPFQYYASTANPHHLAPVSLAAVGTDTQSYTDGEPNFDTANHNYDISVFNDLVGAIADHRMSPDHLPAVSFLKAPGYQDGHAGYSDPIDEQQFITNEINLLKATPDWRTTAVVIAYDDSDGFYDHAFSGVTNPSAGPADALTGPQACGTESGGSAPVAGEQGRCGYGPRLPLLVISPLAKKNYVDHTLTNQTSIIRFVEDNWGLGRIPGSVDAISGSIASMFVFGGNGQQ